MDRIIEIKVNGSHLTKDNRYAGVQHEANVTSLRIEFDGGWDGYAKKVTFWDALGNNPVERTLTTDLLEDMTASTRIYLCPIPGEALTEAGECKFNIDGWVDGKRQRSIETYLEVTPSDFIEEADQPVDPTPTQAEQLQAQIDGILPSMQEQAIIAKNAADAAKESESNAKASEGAAKSAAESIAGAVTETEALRDAAIESAENAAASEFNAASAAAYAASSASAAANASNAASGSAATAGSSAAAAVKSASDAANSAAEAKTSETNAKVSASEAYVSKSDAEASASAAHTAKSGAEAAAEEAEKSKAAAAESAADAANRAAEVEGIADNAAAEAAAGVESRLSEYADAAEEAKTAAEQARNEAQAIAGGEYLTLAGGTVTGPISLAGDPTKDLHAAPKQYVDGKILYGTEDLEAGVTPLKTGTLYVVYE